MDVPTGLMITTETRNKPTVICGKVEEPDHPLYAVLHSHIRTLGSKDNIRDWFLTVIIDPVVKKYLPFELAFLEDDVKTARNPNINLDVLARLMCKFQTLITTVKVTPERTVPRELTNEYIGLKI